MVIDLDRKFGGIPEKLIGQGKQLLQTILSSLSLFFFSYNCLDMLPQQTSKMNFIKIQISIFGLKFGF